MTSATFDLVPFSAVTKASTLITSGLFRRAPHFRQLGKFLSYKTLGTSWPKEESQSGLNGKAGGSFTAVQQAVAPDTDLGR
jgi:hypothetical protein